MLSLFLHKSCFSTISSYICQNIHLTSIFSKNQVTYTVKIKIKFWNKKKKLYIFSYVSVSEQTLDISVTKKLSAFTFILLNITLLIMNFRWFFLLFSFSFLLHWSLLVYYKPNLECLEVYLIKIWFESSKFQPSFGNLIISQAHDCGVQKFKVYSSKSKPFEVTTHCPS